MSNVLPFRLGAGQQVVDTEGESVDSEPQAPGAGAQEVQPPARAQLAVDISAAAQELRAATAQLVAIAPANTDTARLLGTYNSLLQQLQDLHGRLEGATDADLLDISVDLQGAVKSAQEYLTEAGKVIGATGAALAPAGRGKPRWLAIMLWALGASALAGGGYYLWKKSRKKRGPKLGRPSKKGVALDD